MLNRLLMCLLLALPATAIAGEAGMDIGEPASTHDAPASEAAEELHESAEERHEAAEGSNETEGAPHDADPDPPAATAPAGPPEWSPPPTPPPTLDGPHLILSLDSVMPVLTAHRGGWRYPSGGLVHYSRTLHVDARSHVPFGIPDVIAGLIRYAATGNNSMPPLFELLNPDADAIASVRLLSLAMDGVLHRTDTQRFLLGGEYAFTITSRRVQADLTVLEEIDPPSNFEEEKVASTLLNQFALRAGVATDFGGTRLLLTTLAGNGFGGWAAWNPLVGAELALHAPARGWAAFHGRVRYQAQLIDYSGYETNFREQPFYETDLREWNRAVFLDLGVTFRLP